MCSSSPLARPSVGGTTGTGSQPGGGRVWTNEKGGGAQPEPGLGVGTNHGLQVVGLGALERLELAGNARMVVGAPSSHQKHPFLTYSKSQGHTRAGSKMLTSSHFDFLQILNLK